MYLNHMQEKFQISTFGAILVEFGSMDTKNLDFTTNMKFWAKCPKNNELYNKYDITANKSDSIIWVNKF